MRYLVGFVVVLALAFGCVSDEGTTSASIEALCRDYCTCSDNATPECLDQCTRFALLAFVCARNEWQRYISCMTAGSCSNSFDDCDPNNQHPSYEECQVAVQECEEACAPNQAQQCEGSNFECINTCYYGTTCERFAACQDCANSRECWVTGECEVSP